MDKAEEIKTLRLRIESADSKDSQVFSEIVSKFLELEIMERREFAEHYGISVLGTLPRWEKARSCPHPVMRRYIFKDLLKILDQL